MVALVRHDLEFILRQIKIAEANSEAHSGAQAQALTQIYVDANGNVVASTAPEAALAISHPLAPYGLRTVDGSYNNLIAGRDQWGAADNPFPRITDPYWRNETDDSLVFGPGTVLTDGNYGEMGAPPAPTRGLGGGTLVDADPRIISNLIVDQTLNNPAAIYAALIHSGYSGAGLSAALQEIIDAHKAVAPEQAGAVQAQTALTQAQAAAALAQTAATNAANAVTPAQTAADAAAAAVVAADALATSTQEALEAAQDAYDAANADPATTADVLAELLADVAAATLARDDAAAAATDAAADSAAATGALTTALTTSADAAADLVTANAAVATATTNLGTANADLAAAKAALADLLAEHAITMEGQSVVIPNVSPDEGLSAPYNSWFTLFGQFFDHGLDL
ncbi:hypothetical protein ABS774_28945, partial [Methylobacterium oxalidis]